MAQFSDELWRQLIDALLSELPQESGGAWIEVQHQVAHEIRCATFLPADLDDHDRLAVADRVLQHLQHDGHAAVREWRRRQRSAQDHSRWRTFLRVLAIHEARAQLDDRRLDFVPPVGRRAQGRERQ